jgi:hypothetical protein
MFESLLLPTHLALARPISRYPDEDTLVTWTGADFDGYENCCQTSVGTYR